jgi:hypothetical protein
LHLQSDDTYTDSIMTNARAKSGLRSPCPP